MERVGNRAMRRGFMYERRRRVHIPCLKVRGLTSSSEAAAVGCCATVTCSKAQMMDPCHYTKALTAATRHMAEALLTSVNCVPEALDEA